MLTMFVFKHVLNDFEKELVISNGGVYRNFKVSLGNNNLLMINEKIKLNSHGKWLTWFLLREKLKRIPIVGNLLKLIV